MTIVVNGTAYDVEPGTTVAEVVAERGLDERGVAVAVGGTVVRRAGWATRVLAEGDAVELVHAVSGG